jgi:hypothetical protein
MSAVGISGQTRRKARQIERYSAARQDVMQDFNLRLAVREMSAASDILPS